MSEPVDDVRVTVKLIAAKLSLLHQFLILADKGVRQQQSIANDECIAVLRDISEQLTKLLRTVEK